MIFTLITSGVTQAMRLVREERTSCRTPPRLRFVGTGSGTSGVRIDGGGHVLGDSDRPIEGLYAAGSVAALTTTGTAYNSGAALGRGLTLGFLVGHELSGNPVA